MLMALTDICWCLLESTLDYIIRIHLAKLQGQTRAYRNIFFFFFFPIALMFHMDVANYPEEGSTVSKHTVNIIF